MRLLPDTSAASGATSVDQVRDLTLDKALLTTAPTAKTLIEEIQHESAVTAGSSFSVDNIPVRAQFVVSRRSP